MPMTARDPGQPRCPAKYPAVVTLSCSDSMDIAAGPLFSFRDLRCELAVNESTFEHAGYHLVVLYGPSTDRELDGVTYSERLRVQLAWMTERARTQCRSASRTFFRPVLDATGRQVGEEEVEGELLQRCFRLAGHEGRHESAAGAWK